MSKSMRKTLFVVTLTTFLVLVASSFLVSYLSLSQSTLKYRKSVAEAACDFAENVINEDDALAYFTNRTPDSNYNPVLSSLKEYQLNNSETIDRISLVNFSSSKGWYIYDTGGETLGSTLEYNSYLRSVKAELINGRSTFDNKNGKILEYFRPLRTADDVLAGYIIVRVNNPYVSGLVGFIIGFYAVLALFVTILVLVIMIILNRKFFVPLRNLIDSAEHMLEIDEDNDNIEETKSYTTLTEQDAIKHLEDLFHKLFISVTSGEKHLNEALYDANHDGMTHVYNKRYYQSVEDSFRDCSLICAIYFDVNNLKLMNDTLGHESGDYVITRAAEYISSLISHDDYCFRMGGDEFLVIITDSSLRYIVKIVERLEKDCPYILNRDDDAIKCALSFGYAYEVDTYNYEEVLAKAEENMYKKKYELKQLLNMPER